MMRDTASTQPLPSRCLAAAFVLLECRRFSADALLVAADAFDEATHAAGLERMSVAAAQAARIAQMLRAAAPGRARRVVPPFGDVCSPELATAMPGLVA